MPWSAAEHDACSKLVKLALEEDLGERGDVTSQAVIALDLMGCAAFVLRTDGVVAGLQAAELVAATVDAELKLERLVEDGMQLKAGARLATLTGRMRSILAVERTALNFLQRLSGVATLTRRFVNAIEGLQSRILDTRKTTPGWRLLEKYAVRKGGGHNHRLGLYDGILIKDNHLAAAKSLAGTINDARAHWAAALPVEVEVDTLEQMHEVLSATPDIVLLDNMTPQQMREALLLRDQLAPGTLLEASGGVNLHTIRAIAETGVDRISVGALTHSAPALDIALDYLPA